MKDLKYCINHIISTKEQQKNGWNKNTPAQFYRVIKMFAQCDKTSYKCAYINYINFVYNTNFKVNEL